MIISASRRTDLPAFYTPWFLNRVRTGWCAVPNPFNPRQVSRISLRPSDVDALVFWSRWPDPLTDRLDELESLGLKHSLFLITLLDYPRLLEPRQLPLRKRLQAFSRLAERVGPERVIWRYDPIVFSNLTPPEWHTEAFARLAKELRGKTRRCVISELDFYKKMQPRFRGLRQQGITISQTDTGNMEQILPRMAEIAATNGITLQTCAQEQNWTHLGAPPGACIDATYLNRTFDLDLPITADSHQRPHCNCTPSRDIGMYDSCVFGCAYCYATSDFARSRANRTAHDPHGPSLLRCGPCAPMQATLPGLVPE